MGSATNVLEAPSDGNNVDQTGIREQIADPGEGREKGGVGKEERKAIFFLQASRFEFVSGWGPFSSSF